MSVNQQPAHYALNAQQSKRRSETARSRAYPVRLFASTLDARDESPLAPLPAIETEMEPTTLPLLASRA
ncbi:hypothetical protein [Parasitella parasitica]|uniref:Uncharacterized protein n=1 Tax=Parasitella parasitica TaxID=35722 RepID=A0A0B7NFB8_9FUNG|nr:hypothetical protein [Parasitella parasitica]